MAHSTPHALRTRSSLRPRKSKPLCGRAVLEALEDRLLLSTLDITSGALVYTGDNFLSAVIVATDISGTTVVINDPQGPISLTGPGVAGWTGGGTHVVSGPIGSFSSMTVTTGSTAGQVLVLDFTNGDPLPAAGIVYTPAAATGGASSSLNIQGGTFTSEQYAAAGPGAGTITYSDSVQTDVPITFANISSLTDITPSPTFIFNAPAAASAVNLVTGPDPTDEINDSGTGTFQSIDFANKGIATLNVNNAAATTTLSYAAAAGLNTLIVSSGAGNDAVNVQATPAAVTTTIDTGSGSGSSINIGNFGLMSSIQGPVIANATGGSAALTLNDSADNSDAPVTFDNLFADSSTPYEVTSDSFAPIAYGSGITSLTLNGGQGFVDPVTFHINNTQIETTLTINGGFTRNVYDLSNSSEVDGLDNLPGPVVIHGGSNGTDRVILDDSSAPFGDNYVLTSTTVTRIVFGGLTYSGIDSLTLNAENALGTGGNNDITVNGGAANTTINGQGGQDTITVNGTGSSGTFTVNTGATPGSTVNIIGASEPLAVNLGAAGAVNFGSTGGAGTMAGILDGAQITAPTGACALAFHDENDTAAATWSLLDGDPSYADVYFNVQSAIEYNPTILSALQVIAGSGGNAFTVDNTTAFAPTTLDTGTGNDSVHIFASGNNTLFIDGQSGSDAVTLGGATINGMQSLFGTIQLVNDSGTTALTLDDSHDSTSRTGTLSTTGSAETVTGLSSAIINYDDTEIGSVHVLLGSNGNTFTVNGNQPDLSLTGGSGDDTLDLNAEGLTPAFTAGGSIGQVTIARSGFGDLATDAVENLHVFNLPAVSITPGTTHSLNAVEGSNLGGAIVGTFTLQLPTIGTAPGGISAGNFLGSINWGDPSPDAGPAAILQDAANPTLYYLTGSHTFPTAGTFTVGNSIAFTGGTNTSTLNGVSVALQYAATATANTPATATITQGALTASALPLLGVAGSTIAAGPIATFIQAGTVESVGNYTAQITILDAGGTPIASFPGTIIAGSSPLYTVLAPNINLNRGSYKVVVTVTESTSSDSVSAASIAVITDAPLIAGSPVSLAADTGIALASAPLGTFTSADPMASASNFTAVIYWGDGSISIAAITQPGGVGTPFRVTGSHAYTAAGTYAPVVTISAASASTTLNDSAIVTDVPLTAGPAVTLAANTGIVLASAPLGTFTSADPTASTSNFSAVIDWGDGATSIGAITQPAGLGTSFHVTGSHAYTAAGTYAPLITISPAFGSSTTLNDSTIVTDVPLTAGPALSLAANTGIALASAALGTFTSANPAAAASSFTAVIDWSDGNISTGTITQPGGVGTPFHVTGSHTYTAAGTYAPLITISAAFGSTVTLNDSALVTDVPLTAGPAVSLAANTGIALASAALGTFTSANPAAPTSNFSAVIDWGDGTTSTGSITQPAGLGTPFHVTGSHAYTGAGTYAPLITISAATGSTTTLNASATITDLPITAAMNAFSAVQGIDTGTVVLATFTSLNPLATASDFTATLPAGGWGDGLPAAPVTLTIVPTGSTATSTSFEVTASHTYAAPGALPLSLTLTTAAGAATPLTGTATVAHAPATRIVAFTQQPTKVTAGATLGKIVIKLKTLLGKFNPADNSPVTLSIASGPGSTLRGTLTVNAVKGVAVFRNLSLTVAGTYTLIAVDNYATTVSKTITVLPAATARLVLSTPPASVTAGDAISPALTVTAYDAFGNLATNSEIKLSLAASAAHGKLAGTTTATTKNGVATFTKLILKIPGTYALKATHGKLSVTSDTFTATTAA
jgi:hypothetical protein